LEQVPHLVVAECMYW